MRRCLTFSLMLIALIPSGAFADTVTQNGGFETGDFTGWNVWVSAVYPVEFSITTESYSGLYAAKGSMDESGECGSLEQTFTVPQNAKFSFYYKANMQAGNDIYYGNYRILSGWSLYDETTETQITQAYFDHKTEYTLVSYNLSAFAEHDMKFRVYVGSDGQSQILIDPPYEVFIDDVYCIPKNLLPVAEAGDNQTVVEDDIVYLNGSASYDPDGTIISYDWDFGDGSTGIGINVTHRYDKVDNYTVTLMVTDNDNAKVNDTCSVVVEPDVPSSEGNQPPVSMIWSDYQEILVGEEIKFNGSGSYDPDGYIVSYDWDFGDSSPHSTGVNSSHIYNTPGDYINILSVIDNAGAINNDTCVITVLSKNQSTTIDEGTNHTDFKDEIEGSDPSKDPPGTDTTYIGEDEKIKDISLSFYLVILFFILSVFIVIFIMKKRKIT